MACPEQIVQSAWLALQVSAMVEAVAELLAQLHASGCAHRDLKPDNVLYLLNSAQWRLLDMGIAGPIGERCASGLCFCER